MWLEGGRPPCRRPAQPAVMTSHPDVVHGRPTTFAGHTESGSRATAERRLSVWKASSGVSGAVIRYMQIFSSFRRKPGYGQLWLSSILPPNRLCDLAAAPPFSSFRQARLFSSVRVSPRDVPGVFWGRGAAFNPYSTGSGTHEMRAARLRCVCPVRPGLGHGPVRPATFRHPLPLQRGSTAWQA